MLNTLARFAILVSFHHLASRQVDAAPTHIEARQAQACTGGGTWTRIVESFDGLNQTLWTLEGASGASFGRQGAVMTVTQAAVGSYECAK
jgi:hypothetical protein